jgi:hypothetical protein
VNRVVTSPPNVSRKEIIASDIVYKFCDESDPLCCFYVVGLQKLRRELHLEASRRVSKIFSKYILV